MLYLLVLLSFLVLLSVLLILVPVLLLLVLALIFLILNPIQGKGGTLCSLTKSTPYLQNGLEFGDSALGLCFL